MEIISGLARGMVIQAPRGMEVRPTSVRARQSLMDSLRNFDGLKVVDLCAGSGSVGLEAASRGAAEVLFVDQNFSHCKVIEQNIAQVRKSGAEFESEVVCSSILEPERYRRRLAEPDLIFADPPYAESAELYRALMAKAEFLEWAAAARIIWELPDTKGAAGEFITLVVPGRRTALRKLGSASFLFVEKADG